MIKILYYEWGENTGQDCRDNMQALGWQVSVVKYRLLDYDKDDLFEEQIHLVLKEGYDCIFSFDFFPILSRIAKDAGVIYISWVYDSPHLTLESVTLSNVCNAVFLFDRRLCERYQHRGITTVHHMPLAYNRHRMEQVHSSCTKMYHHEVSFLGSLYDDSYNFWDQVTYLPEEDKGYVEGLVACQQFIYGLDLCETLMTWERCHRLLQYIKIELPNNYADCEDEILRNMIRKKITVVERRKLLQSVGERYPLDLYSTKAPNNLPVNYLGYADYFTQMPKVFCSSKINLNITLRSILSGIPLRIIDILGAGGFVLTNYQTELEEYFTYGENIMWFDSPEDLLEKVKYFLQHDAVRERLKQNGHRQAKKIFTYETLLPKMFAEAFGRNV